MIVDTRSGKLEGTEGDGILSFKGIPYAAAPLGPLRFRPPQPAEAWQGVRPATAFGPAASQNASLVERLLGGTMPVTSEDSLTLNVWTPALDDAARPVLVWIHGGGFTTGSGATPWYDGSRTARGGDVVVVTINYRLGALGFLYLAEVDGATEAHASSGNTGILDQVAALEWVRDNIAAFGGDPGNVTVFGESAGAMSVGTLLGVPAAQGLFHRAILESGAAHNVYEAATAAAHTAEMLDALGVSSLGELEAVPVERILAASSHLGEETAARGLLFQPVVDGAAVPRHPLDAIAAGSAADVPVLIGTTLDEWALFALADKRTQGMDEVALLRHVRPFFASHDATAAAIDTYCASRPTMNPADVFSAMLTDRVFRIPALRLAEAQLAAGGQAHVYLFTYATPAFGGRLGSCHALDIPFVFDNLDAPGARMFAGPDAPQSLATAMNQAWVSFARTADPGWDLYDTTRRPTMVFDAASSLTDDPLGAERACWDGLL